MMAKATCVVLSLEAPAKEPHIQFEQLVFGHSTKTRWLVFIHKWEQNALHRHCYQSVCKSFTIKFAGCSVTVPPCVFHPITQIEDPGHRLNVEGPP